MCSRTHSAGFSVRSFLRLFFFRCPRNERFTLALSKFTSSINAQRRSQQSTEVTTTDARREPTDEMCIYRFSCRRVFFFPPSAEERGPKKKIPWANREGKTYLMAFFFCSLGILAVILTFSHSTRFLTAAARCLECTRDNRRSAAWMRGCRVCGNTNYA